MRLCDLCVAQTKVMHEEQFCSKKTNFFNTSKIINLHDNKRKEMEKGT